jgi:Cof subfamily protein (haloacid dehalogenase superfamily)
VSGISLVISDVDGTLVDSDKQLTDASKRAVRRLREQGIAFTIVSSRPPFGMRMFVEPLGLSSPLGAFNGCTIVAPDLGAIERHVVPEQVAREGIAMLTDFGADVWIFTTEHWLVRNLSEHYIPREKRTVRAEPQLVESFEPYLGKAGKIVGSSTDFDRLAACEAATRTALGERASVVRSQSYYLDITPAGFNKGTFVDHLSRSLARPPAQIAVLGDMENDLDMFCRAGLAIAMGNASPDVQRQASCVTASNKEEGFALAIERYVLGNADGIGRIV